jgi:hypothetical protein
MNQNHEEPKHPHFLDQAIGPLPSQNETTFPLGLYPLFPFEHLGLNTTKGKLAKTTS